MNNFIKIPAVLLTFLVVAKVALPVEPHVAPLNPKSHVLDITVEGAGAYQISMWVPAGSTSDSVPGIAHVIEHLKFKNHDGDGFSAFDAIPGSSSNAATTYRTTRYDLNVPPSGVTNALAILSAMTKSLAVDEGDVKLEKSVVAQELLQRTQSDPDTPFYQEFYSALYEGLPYEHSPGGTQESVASVTLNDVMAFDRANYKDSKVFVLIAGPALSTINQSAIKHFFPEAAIGTLNVSRKLELTRDDAELKGFENFLPKLSDVVLHVSELQREKTSPRARNIKIILSKIISAPTTWRAVAAANILQDAVRSRLPEGLQDRIAEDNRLVQDWSFSISRLMENVWQIDFSASVESGVTPELVRAAFEKYVVDISATGLSQKSFDRLKSRNFLLSEWESAEARSSTLGSDTVTYGYEKALNFTDELQKTQLPDVNDLLRSLQKPGRVGQLLLKPEGTS